MGFGNSFVTDGGGNNYNRPGFGRKVDRRSSVVSSYACTDCGTLRYTTKFEWTRASKPRCLKCGGPLDETKATVKKMRKRSK